jgi:hypothetical protein
MYTTGIIQTSQAFFVYTDTGYNVQLYTAHSPCFCLPLLTPLCLPIQPPSTYLTWNPPSCDRIRPPRSKVACKLTSPVPTLSPKPSPLQIPRTPATRRPTETTSGRIRRLLSGTRLADFESFCQEQLEPT